jgi:hypothetical protein
MLRKYGEVNALLRDQAGSDTAIVQFEHHAMAAAFYRADGGWWWSSRGMATSRLSTES